MLELIIGPSGFGKTHHILEDIKSKRDSSKIIVITPDQNSYNFEKMLGDSLEGTFNIDVVNLSRLYKKMCTLAGVTLNLLAEEDKYFCYLELLERLRGADNFFIKRLEQDIEFIHVINDLIEELDEYGVSIEKLMEYTNTSDRDNKKIEDLTEVYRAYLHILVDNNEYTKQGYIEYVIKCMEYVDLSEYIFYIDAYYNFSPLEYSVIELLIKKSKKVVISIISELDRYTNFRIEHLVKSEINKEKLYTYIDLDDVRDKSEYSLDIYRKSHEVIAYLNNIILKNRIKKINIVTFYSDVPKENYKIYLSIENASIELKEIEKYAVTRFDSPELYYLQKEFTKLSKSYKETEKKNVRVYEASNIEGEMKQLARNISKEIIENDYKLSDIAVLYRDDVYENYAYLLKDSGINIHIDKNKDITNHRLIKLVKNLLNYSDQNFKSDILNILKSNLVNISISDANIKFTSDDIEKVLDIKLINSLQDLKREHFALETEGFSSEDLGYMQNYLLNLVDMINKLKKKAKVKDFVKGILKILEILDIEKNIFAEPEKTRLTLTELEEKDINQQVFDKFIKILESISKHGEKKVSYKTFSEIISILMNKIVYRSIPLSEESVIMSKIDLSKVENKKIIFVLGMNKDILPKSLSLDGIIDDEDKYALSLFGIELSPRVKSLMTDEDFVAYIALTRSKEKLYISYSLLNSKFTPQKQSLYIDTIYKILDEGSGNILKINTDSEILYDLDELNEYDILKNKLIFYSKLEVLYYFNKIKYSMRLDTENKRYLTYLNEMYRKLLSSVNGPNEINYEVQEKLDYVKDVNKYSYSKLRRYEQNPFVYFVENILEVSSEKDYGLSVLLLGAYKHAILEDEKLLEYINVKVKDETKGEYGDTDVYIESLHDEIKDKIVSVMNESDNQAITNYMQITENQGITSYLSDMILEGLVKSVGIEIQYRIISGYRISKTEKKFTLNCTANSISLKLDNGREITKNLSKTYEVDEFKLTGIIDRIDEKNGQYIVVDYKSSKVDFGIESFYNKELSQLLLYMMAVVFIEEAEASKIQGIFYRELAKKDKDNKEYRLRGIMNGELIRSVDHLSEIAFIRIKKDGEPYASDQHKVYTDEELTALMNMNIEYLYQLVERIQNSYYNLSSLEEEYKFMFNYVLNENINIEKEYEKIAAKDFKKLILKT